ncbi:hypothetical protein SDC9_119161 [bioreactor metagenome]|uniref:Uncharacterized protein n=1 Tax=bioreactor metagenome TaxID=1076179 RepID=A0A645C487_9ZZZZ
MHQGIFVGSEFKLLDIQLFADDIERLRQQPTRLGVGRQQHRAGQRLAHLEVVLGPEKPAELHRGHGQLHLLFQRFVAHRAVRLRIIAAMDRFGHARSAQIAVDRFGGEGNERRRGPAESQQHMMQRRIGFQLVLVVARLPETAAAAADVPVGQIVDETLEAVRRLLKIVMIQFKADLFDHLCAGAQNPAVERIGRTFGSRRARSRLIAVDIGVGYEKAVGIPHRDHHVAEHFLDAVFRKLQIFGAHHLRPQHEQPQRIRAVTVDHIHRIGIILLALGHLLPVLGQNQPVHDHMLERRLVEQRRAQHHQRVKPAAGLVQPLGDEIGREVGFEMLLVFKRIMLLRIRHRTGFKPAVEHFRNPPQRAFAGRRRNGHFIDEMLVQVGHLAAGELFQLGHTADADHFTLFVAPDRKRRPPVAVAADRPVAGVFQPLAETAVAQVGRHPADFAVGRAEPLLDRFDLDKPG